VKKIQEILKKKISRAGAREIKGLDEKTIVRVFLEVAKERIENLEDSDIREIKIEKNILYVKTAHPVVSSELLLRREEIMEKTKEIVGGKKIERIVIR